MNSSGPSMLPSPCVVMVRDKFVVKADVPKLVERRMGQSSDYKNDSACDLCDLESCVCWDSAVCVKSLQSFHSTNTVNRCLIGRDQEYQTLNLTYAVNIIKIAMIISIFPKPLKPYVVLSCPKSVS
jgi:hypothetical protein